MTVLAARTAPRGAVVVAATVAGVVVAQAVAARAGVGWVPGGDLAVYRAAGEAVLAGLSPYEVDLHGYRFVYTPFAAVLLTPLALLVPGAAYWAWTTAAAAGLARYTTAGALLLSPVAATLLLGNVNLLLMAMVLADLLLVRGRARGVLTGLAAGIKLTPLIFIVYLFLIGRIRAGLTAAAAFAGTVAAGFLALPGPSTRYWSGMFLDGSRTRPPGEDAFGTSVRGAVGHLVPGAPTLVWIVLSLIVGVSGLTVAVIAHRRGRVLHAIVLCAVTGLLVSPVTWYSHWVWCLPILAVVRSRVLWVVFALPLPWWIVYVLGLAPVPEHAWWMPVELLYTLTGLALLGTAANWGAGDE
ncbi:glycosyltransferase 87 family protein [Catenuloplanes indicus]|uniref:Alpha-1,2-mannosyltransferase n=1 Tax=Catenuloplanes indicus TaxID=137267 RepID=A0AAE4AVR7_9ACTN|nr:glycosyltransferase 87 family protein [Catenuloplanes indicus]MDQ0363946.1 alpha-1,2-mannosyltransferase [Catenuloplanes indicus]